MGALEVGCLIAVWILASFWLGVTYMDYSYWKIEYINIGVIVLAIVCLPATMYYLIYKKINKNDGRNI